MKKDLIIKLLYKFEKLGVDKSNDGAVLIGKAPHNGPRAWLNILYPILNKEELLLLGEELKTEIPNEYADFLLNFGNGLNVLSSTFSLYGFRKQIQRNPEANIRQPYSIVTPNIFERPDNANESYFFIGGYNWDGSHLYIDKETNNVHCCERWDATSRKRWSSLEEMILTEIKRLYNLFDDKGVEIDEDKETIPY